MNTEKDQNDKQLAEAENLADEFFGKLGESLGINLSWAKKPVFAEKEKREIKLDIVLDNPMSTPEQFLKKKASDLGPGPEKKLTSNLKERNEEDLFQDRLNNVKEERKKRNVTFHGIPEVQDKDEVTPKNGMKPPMIDNFNDAQGAYER